MTLEQSTEDAFSAVTRLEWLLLHAKAADFARIDMEREVPQCAEQIRRALRVYSDSALMTAELLCSAERQRCLRITEEEKVDAASTHEDTDIAYNAACDHIAARIREGK